jgi:hypothetical protein
MQRWRAVPSLGLSCCRRWQQRAWPWTSLLSSRHLTGLALAIYGGAGVGGDWPVVRPE